MGNDRQFAAFCRVVGVPALAQHPDYREAGGRSVHREALKEKLEAAMSSLDGGQRFLREKIPAFRCFIQRIPEGR